MQYYALPYIWDDDSHHHSNKTINQFQDLRLRS